MEEDIIGKAQKIAEILSIENQQPSIEDLSNAKFYFDVFKMLFPYLYVTFDEISNTSNDDGKKIQALIDMLSNDILTLDLSHIQGSLIQMGEEKNIWHFLEILDELIQMC